MNAITVVVKLPDEVPIIQKIVDPKSFFEQTISGMVFEGHSCGDYGIIFDLKGRENERPANFSSGVNPMFNPIYGPVVFAKLHPCRDPLKRYISFTNDEIARLIQDNDFGSPTDLRTEMEREADDFIRSEPNIQVEDRVYWRHEKDGWKRGIVKEVSEDIALIEHWSLGQGRVLNHKVKVSLDKVSFAFRDEPDEISEFAQEVFNEIGIEHVNFAIVPELKNEKGENLNCTLDDTGEIFYFCPTKITEYATGHFMLGGFGLGKSLFLVLIGPLSMVHSVKSVKSFKRMIKLSNELAVEQAKEEASHQRVLNKGVTLTEIKRSLKLKQKWVRFYKVSKEMAETKRDVGELLLSVHNFMDNQLIEMYRLEQGEAVDFDSLIAKTEHEIEQLGYLAEQFVALQL